MAAPLDIEFAYLLRAAARAEIAGFLLFQAAAGTHRLEDNCLADGDRLEPNRNTLEQRTASERPCRVVAFDGDDTLWIDDTDEKRWERDCKRLSVEGLPHPMSRRRSGGMCVNTGTRRMVCSAR
jgi:hypothetical protein